MVQDPFCDEGEDSGIDLTPLIDVVFMLLIFFIMSTVFIKPSIHIDLPRTEHAAQQQARGTTLVLALDAAGQFFHQEQQLAMGEMLALLDEYPDASVNLFVDKRAPFEPFIQFIDQAKARGREEIVVTTQPDENTP